MFSQGFWEEMSAVALQEGPEWLESDPQMGCVCAYSSEDARKWKFLAFMTNGEISQAPCPTALQTVFTFGVSCSPELLSHSFWRARAGSCSQSL